MSKTNDLILPLKKKWFDMIASGEKKEEYREIKEYWRTRFQQNKRTIRKDGLQRGFGKKI